LCPSNEQLATAFCRRPDTVLVEGINSTVRSAAHNNILLVRGAVMGISLNALQYVGGIEFENGTSLEFIGRNASIVLTSRADNLKPTDALWCLQYGLTLTYHGRLAMVLGDTAKARSYFSQLCDQLEGASEPLGIAELRDSGCSTLASLSLNSTGIDWLGRANNYVDAIAWDAPLLKDVFTSRVQSVRDLSQFIGNLDTLIALRDAAELSAEVLRKELNMTRQQIFDAISNSSQVLIDVINRTGSKIISEIQAVRNSVESLGKKVDDMRTEIQAGFTALQRRLDRIEDKIDKNTALIQKLIKKVDRVIQLQQQQLEILLRLEMKMTDFFDRLADGQLWMDTSRDGQVDPDEVMHLGLDTSDKPCPVDSFVGSSLANRTSCASEELRVTQLTSVRCRRRTAMGTASSTSTRGCSISWCTPTHRFWQAMRLRAFMETSRRFLENCPR
jgi:hypothetical protein